MSEASEVFEVMGQVVDENTSDMGIDVVNVLVGLVDMLKASPDMTVELWETFQLSINNSVAIMNNLIDEELSRIKAEETIPDF